MRALGEAGYQCGHIHIDTLDDRMLEFYDMLIMMRTGAGDPEEIRKSIQFAKNLGKIVILDYDDDVLRVPDHNPGKPVSTDGILAAMDECHGCVVTNETLKRSFLSYHKNIEVIPNYMDPKGWPKNTPRYSNKLTIGLTGSPTHIRDWEIVARPMFNIRQRHDVEFLVAGFLPDYLKPSVSIQVEWVPLQYYQIGRAHV